MATLPASAALYRKIWRWHFYAGIFVIPMMLFLSLSGALYLFKPQIDRWEERSFHNLPTAGAVAPSAQLAAALAAHPGAKPALYRLPEQAGDAAAVRLALPGGAKTDVFVSPQGRVLGEITPGTRIIDIDRKIHGQLLIGKPGSWLVEFAASWAIFLIVSGLYLWWPRGRGAAGVLYPRFHLGSRVGWRDVHAVTGFWVSAAALFLLLTGLPWADAWGSAFKGVRQEMGWMKGPQDWTIGGRVVDGGDEHAGHDHAAMAGMDMGAMGAMPGMAHGRHGHHPASANPALFDTMVDHARAEHLAFPAEVVFPGMPAGEGGFGRPAKGWVVKSDAQNRPLRVTLRYDGITGALKSREDITNRHPIDKVMAYGIAAHEGQLFGVANQLLGLATALSLVALIVSGFVMWRRRKPEGVLGAPPFAKGARLVSPVGWALLIWLLVWLPMFTGSLLILWAFDRWALPYWPRAARWLGAAPV